MRHLFRLRPSPAMVVACIALSVALGGTSYAAITLPRNSVGTPQLKKNAVTSPKVKNNALTGADINEASLGRVPSATSATNATNATNATTATTATNATNAGNADTTDGRSLGCPTGTQEYAGLCIETAVRVAATWSAASTTCGDLGRRLPTTSELNGFRQQTGITLGSPSETSSTVTDDNTTEFKITIDDAGALFGIDVAIARPFRCAAPLVR